MPIITIEVMVSWNIHVLKYIELYAKYKQFVSC